MRHLDAAGAAASNRQRPLERAIAGASRRGRKTAARFWAATVALVILAAFGAPSTAAETPACTIAPEMADVLTAQGQTVPPACPHTISFRFDDAQPGQYDFVFRDFLAFDARVPFVVLNWTGLRLPLWPVAPADAPAFENQGNIEPFYPLHDPPGPELVVGPDDGPWHLVTAYTVRDEGDFERNRTVAIEYVGDRQKGACVPAPRLDGSCVQPNRVDIHGRGPAFYIDGPGLTARVTWQSDGAVVEPFLVAHENWTIARSINFDVWGYNFTDIGPSANGTVVFEVPENGPWAIYFTADSKGITRQSLTADLEFLGAPEEDPLGPGGIGPSIPATSPVLFASIVVAAATATGRSSSRMSSSDNDT